jgi:hypothetical protein
MKPLHSAPSAATDPAEDSDPLGVDFFRNAAISAVLAAVAFYRGWQYGGAAHVWAGVLLLIVAAGLWHRQAWARWLAFLAALAMFVGGCWLLVEEGATWRALALMFFGPAWTWELLSFPSNAVEEPEESESMPADLERQ